MSLSETAASDSSEIDWLKCHSMLLQYDQLVSSFAGQSQQWKHAYGFSRPLDALEKCSVWLATYSSSIVGPQGAKVLDVLGEEKLYMALAELGVQAIHTGPMKRAGSVNGKRYRPSIDGHFDRIELKIDPDYGDQALYQQMVHRAKRQGISIIGDLVPGHTGKGPDFRLAERNVPGFPGLFTMIEIAAEHWDLLPDVPANQDSVNLSLPMVSRLRQEGYHLVGPLDAEVFATPGVKESSWGVTREVIGVDGANRRWVYLHIFKQGQPSLNWSDPSFGAYRLQTADLLHSLCVLGIQGLRMDATMFLGIEEKPGEQSTLLGHPLSNQVTDLLGMMVRKFGGFSFQELNVDLEQIKGSLSSGPEFNYDFTTRPAYLYALASGDAGPSD